MLAALLVVSVVLMLVLIVAVCASSPSHADRTAQEHVSIGRYLDNLVDDDVRFSDGRHLVMHVCCVLGLEREEVETYLEYHMQYVDLLCNCPMMSAFIEDDYAH